MNKIISYKISSQEKFLNHPITCIFVLKTLKLAYCAYFLCAHIISNFTKWEKSYISMGKNEQNLFLIKRNNFRTKT